MNKNKRTIQQNYIQISPIDGIDTLQSRELD